MGKLNDIKCDFCKRGKCFCLFSTKAYCKRCWITKMKKEDNQKELRKLINPKNNMYNKNMKGGDK